MTNYLALNKWIYNATAPLYESRHSEIFNQTEQHRIQTHLGLAVQEIRTASKNVQALDFGAGTGNLTRHLIRLGAHVMAADVSSGCLREVLALSGNSGRLDVSLLNGHDLSQFANESFDMVATYSVLHHVPDYLAIVREFLRVVKPGGVIYIDHEVCPAYWEDRQDYTAYCEELAAVEPMQRNSLRDRFFHVFSRKNRWRYLASALWLTWHKISDEGDIHVHPDDHIEWPDIKACLEPYCEIVREDDYLVCREQAFPPPIWEKWRELCVDMRCLIAVKR